MTRKQELGQFFTTNFEYITDGMDLDIEEKFIIEPFAGNKDLLRLLKNVEEHRVECYDIDPKHDDIILRDSLLDPPKYYNKYVITNPPYLARNKSRNKQVFDKYKQNDLYKCFIECILKDNVKGGIIIIPLNSAFYVVR